MFLKKNIHPFSQQNTWQLKTKNTRRSSTICTSPALKFYRPKKMLIKTEEISISLLKNNVSFKVSVVSLFSLCLFCFVSL